MVYITAERFIPEVDKLTVRQLRQSQGMSQRQLAEKAVISTASVSYIEDPNYKYCTSFEAAMRVSEALGVPFHRIRWLHAHSDKGRPVGSGGTQLRSVKATQESRVCESCFLTLPATGICDDCS